MQLANHGLIDLAGSKIKAGQILVGGEPCGLHLIGDRTHLTLGHLGFEQLGQDRDCSIERRRPLLDEIAGRFGHAIHFEAAQHHYHGSASRVMTHGPSP